MDQSIIKQKLEMWKQKRAQIEQDMKDAATRKGEAARDGDLRENAAYKQAIEDMEMCRVRLTEIDKIISDLETGKGAQ